MIKQTPEELRNISEQLYQKRTQEYSTEESKRKCIEFIDKWMLKEALDEELQITFRVSDYNGVYEIEYRSEKVKVTYDIFNQIRDSYQSIGYGWIDSPMITYWGEVKVTTFTIGW